MPCIRSFNSKPLFNREEPARAINDPRGPRKLEANTASTSDEPVVQAESNPETCATLEDTHSSTATSEDSSAVTDSTDSAQELSSEPAQIKADTDAKTDSLESSNKTADDEKN